MNHPAKELDSRRKASGVLFGKGERRQLACGVWQLAKHNIVGKLPTIAGKLPALPGGRVRRS